MKRSKRRLAIAVCTGQTCITLNCVIWRILSIRDSEYFFHAFATTFVILIGNDFNRCESKSQSRKCSQKHEKRYTFQLTQQLNN